MKNCCRIVIGIFIVILMSFLIANTKDAIVFATDALKLCTEALIPSLFPVMFLAILLNNVLTNFHFRFMHWMGRICRIPEGSENLFLLGVLGGYPVGAQMIANTYESGNLKKEDAQRMLGFCNNAGPSFIFGIMGPIFHSIQAPLLLWLIQILSALITGALLFDSGTKKISVHQQGNMSVTKALERSVKTMALICGWVVLFRIATGFINLKLSSYVPQYISILVTGALELTNGSVALYGIKNLGARFILSAWFLTTGGLCVALQTASAVKSLGIKHYIQGKFIQGLISLALAYIVQYVIFPVEYCYHITVLDAILFLLLALVIIIFMNYKKTVAFQNKLVYN